MTNSADPDQLAYWIYTVCKNTVYPGSEGLGLTCKNKENPVKFTQLCIIISSVTGWVSSSFSIIW